MAASANDIITDVDKLRKEFEQFRADLAVLREDLKGYGKGKAADLKEAAEERLEALRQELDRLTGDLQTQGRASVAQAQTAVRENPLAALAIAFGAGMLVSIFLARR